MEILMKSCVEFAEVELNKVGSAGPGQVRYYIKKATER